MQFRARARVRAHLIIAVVAGASIAALAAETACAVMRPFVFAGGVSQSAEKDDLDDFLDPYTIHESGGAWEAGAGVRFFPRADLEEAGQRAGAWELRLRFGLGGGDLEDLTIRGRRFVDQNSFEFVSEETYEYSYWVLGTAFQVNLHPRAAVFLGPALQSVTIDGRRNWTGETGCYECGDASEEATKRYGLLELGARVRPFAWPLFVEGYWVPSRFELSATQIRESDNWSTANFASFTKSLGARLSYDF